ncbi:10350_t:CDS:2, partial [Dentiscutata erythropus]
NNEAQRNNEAYRNNEAQRNNKAYRNNEAQRNSEPQFIDKDYDSETFNSQYHINLDNDLEKKANLLIKNQKELDPRTIHKAIREKMNTIKYLSNKQLEIVSKIALEIHNKDQLDAILINLSWKNLWNNSIAPAEYQSEIKIKVKKALTEVFGRDQFPLIEQARPSADQQVFSDETTKNNIAFASICIDVICNANYSGYELQQKYIIQEMNSSLRGMESSELEIELEANEASTSDLEREEE